VDLLAAELVSRLGRLVQRDRRVRVPIFVATVPSIEYDTKSTVVGEPYSASVSTKVCAPASAVSRMSGVRMGRHAGPGELEGVAALDDRRDLLGAAVEVEAQRPLS